MTDNFPTTVPASLNSFSSAPFPHHYNNTMLHSYSSTTAEPSSSTDQHIHLGYWGHENHHRSPAPILNDPHAGLERPQRIPKPVEYHGYENLLRARELRRQQAREHEVTSQLQSTHYCQTKEEQDLAKALEDFFITETAHRLFLKNKQREEDRVRKAQEELLIEQHRREADQAREQYYIDQYYQQQKEKAERRQRRKERKAQQKQQQQYVSFVTPSSSPTIPAPAPLISPSSSTYSSSTSSSNSTKEISNPENKQLQRLEKRFQLRRQSPENDNPNSGREVYHNPFMQPATRTYVSPSSSRSTIAPTISLSTVRPQSPVSSTSYLKRDFDREREIAKHEVDRQRAQEKVKQWMGDRERARYSSSSRFRKETRRSRSRSRAGRNYGDGYHETVWEKEERETKVAVDDWIYDDSR